MSYTLASISARRFIKIFYKELFRLGNFTKAMAFTRSAMAQSKVLNGEYGRYVYEDWLVPVIYGLFVPDKAMVALPKLEKKPVRAYSVTQDMTWFVGRDAELYKLECSINDKRNNITLVHGLAAVGKTATVTRFLQWIERSGSIYEKIYSFNARGLCSATDLISDVFKKVLGENASVDINHNLSQLLKYLKNHHIILFIDGFALVKTYADKEMIKGFFAGLRRGKCKVILASYSEETWLGESLSKIHLTGLVDSDLNQYLLSLLGRHQIPHNKYAVEVLSSPSLKGLPGLISTIIKQLKVYPPEEWEERLNSELQNLCIQWKIHNVKILKPASDMHILMLKLIGMHLFYVDGLAVRFMLESMLNSSSDGLWECFVALEDGGLITRVGKTLYEISPLLQCFLKKYLPVQNVNEQGRQALAGQHVYEGTNAIRGGFGRYGPGTMQLQKAFAIVTTQNILHLFRDGGLHFYKENIENALEIAKYYQLEDECEKIELCLNRFPAKGEHSRSKRERSKSAWSQMRSSADAYNIKDYKKAISHLNQAIAGFKAIDSYLFASYALVELAQIYADIGEYEQVEIYANESIRMFNEAPLAHRDPDTLYFMYAELARKAVANENILYAQSIMLKLADQLKNEENFNWELSRIDVKELMQKDIDSINSILAGKEEHNG